MIFVVRRATLVPSDIAPVVEVEERSELPAEPEASTAEAGPAVVCGKNAAEEKALPLAEERVVEKPVSEMVEESIL